jgi:hypothetical protein
VALISALFEIRAQGHFTPGFNVRLQILEFEGGMAGATVTGVASNCQALPTEI